MTAAPREIPRSMAERIRSTLSAIEAEHGVRIVLAVESGSRAWGFPSRDSDYDVRFIYVRPVADYLTVMARRDVIERPVDSELDLNGWDIRKAISLMLKSNAVLQEWLTSPICYVEYAAVSERLKALLDEVADVHRFEYHYEHQAQCSFDAVCAIGPAVRMKDYCYAIRASLALRWLRERGTLPPMDLASLMEGIDLPDGLGEAIVRLVDRKSCGDERDTVGRCADLDEFIVGSLADRAPTEERAAPRDKALRADALFASIVLGDLGSR